MVAVLPSHLAELLFAPLLAAELKKMTLVTSSFDQKKLVAQEGWGVS